MASSWYLRTGSTKILFSFGSFALSLSKYGLTAQVFLPHAPHADGLDLAIANLVRFDFPSVRSLFPNLLVRKDLLMAASKPEKARLVLAKALKSQGDPTLIVSTGVNIKNIIHFNE